MTAHDDGRRGSAWRIWIDTGGTFTDCVATDPRGRTTRIKVLSDSSLRGTVSASDTSRRPVLAMPWTLPGDFLAGRELRLGARHGRSARILGSAADGTVELDADLGAVVGEPWEVRFAEEVPVLAAHLATSTRPGDALPAIAMRLATTRATNALLERSGARTLLVTTRGFADLLRIGSQQRPDLFAAEVRLEPPLHAGVVEVDERLDSAGREVRPLDEATLEEALGEALGEAVGEAGADGYEAAAVVFLNSYRDGGHERRAARALGHLGVRHVSRSSVVAPLQGAVPRGQTTVVNAYLAPSIEDYLDGVASSLRDGRLRVMTSAGGLQAAAEVRPKDCLLSGPAGGVVGAVRAAAAAGLGRLISFDMGGTSTDVARYDGEFDYRFETRIAGTRLMAPTLAIETVAAGGGSVCRFEDGRLRVGPQSAGARPGPACYGGGGPLALTDVNVLLGRLDPERFEIPLSRAAADERLEELLGRLEASGETPGETPVPEVILSGLLEIANERMAEAIRRISVRRGYDPAEFALVAFGGAGGQHACAVAALLGMETILVPADASVLSAWGLGHARLERFVERQVLEPLERFEDGAAVRLEELGEAAREALIAEGVAAGEVEVRRVILRLRLAGQESTIPVDFDARRPLSEVFSEAYRSRFGYEPPERDVEVESVRVVASTRQEPLPEAPERVAATATPVSTRRCFLDGGWLEAPVFVRESLRVGESLRGPALVVERFGAVVVESGWRCRVGPAGGLLLERSEGMP